MDLSQETPKRGYSRYGRKRKLTNEYNNAVNSPTTSENTDEILSTPSQLEVSTNLGRTRRLTRSFASENDCMIVEFPKSPATPKKKKKHSRKQQANTRRLSVVPPKTRRGRKKSVIVVDDDDDNEPADYGENDEFIDEQLIKISMNEQPDVNLLESNLVEQLTIDPANFRPAEKLKKILFKIKKAPEAQEVTEFIVPD